MIDFINLFAKKYVDYVADDQIQKQGYFLPGCGKQILSFEDAINQAQGSIGAVLLGTYKENEAKILQRCRSVLSPQVVYIPLYTPSNLN